jgi:hypothetical protein
MDGWGVALLLPLLLPVAVGSTVADAVRLALALGEDVGVDDADQQLHAGPAPTGRQQPHDAE